MPQRHTQHQPDQLAHPTGADSVTRNAHGQSLDDARETFRTEWEEKLWALRERAEQARRRAEGCRKIGEFIFVGGPVFGAYFGAVIAPFSFHEVGWAGAALVAVASAGAGVVFGLTSVIPVLLLVAGCRWFYRSRAQWLEREVEKLERS